MSTPNAKIKSELQREKIARVLWIGLAIQPCSNIIVLSAWGLGHYGYLNVQTADLIAAHNQFSPFTLTTQAQQRQTGRTVRVTSNDARRSPA